MAILKRTAAGLTTATPVTIGTVGLGAKYGILREIRCRNWASSAKAGAGTDTAIKVKLTDNNSNVVYLDATDRDYATAAVVLVPSLDDTATGLGVTPVDATGAAATAGAGAPIIMESPVSVIIVNGGTATDYVQVDLLVEV
jgi:hypothetical protein